jgi:hypothetical protein
MTRFRKLRISNRMPGLATKLTLNFGGGKGISRQEFGTTNASFSLACAFVAQITVHWPTDQFA